MVSKMAIAVVFTCIGVLVLLFKYMQIHKKTEPATVLSPIPTNVQSVGIKPYGCCEKGQLEAVFGLGKVDTFDACKQVAARRGMRYFGLGRGSTQNGKYVGECWATPFINDMSDLSVPRQSTNCEIMPGTDVSSGKDSAMFLYTIL